MEQNSQMTSTERIAEELARWAGSGALIVDHMARWPSTGKEELSAPDALRKLLRETLEPIAERHAAEDLAVAAEVLTDAVETLGSEILLVDPSVLDEEPWAPGAVALHV
jgi:hypothetical protein